MPTTQGYHYVTVFMVCETDEEPVNTEPEKCRGWEWVQWDAPEAEVRACACVHVFSVCVCKCVCARARVCVSTSVRFCLKHYPRTHAHTHIHAHARAHTHTFTRTYTRAYTCRHARTPACIHTHAHTHACPYTGAPHAGRHVQQPRAFPDSGVCGIGGGEEGALLPF